MMSLNVQKVCIARLVLIWNVQSTNVNVLKTLSLEILHDCLKTLIQYFIGCHLVIVLALNDFIFYFFY